ARRVPLLAVLADGQRTVSRRWLRALLRLCPGEDRIRHRPLRHGNEAAVGRARPTPRGKPVSCRPGLYDRRHPPVAMRRPRGARGTAYGAAEFRPVQEYKNVQRWAETIAQRPAVKRGRIVNRMSGPPSEQLHERHDASDFETRTQDKLAPAAS